MAAGTWKIYAKAKKYMGNGTINLGTGPHRLCLLTGAASAAILALSTRSTWNSLSANQVTGGGYLADGESLTPLWTVGASAKQYKYTYASAGIVVTGSIANIKYALIRNSTGAGTGYVICFCTLSTAQFNLTGTNTLTIIPATTGVFTLA